MPRHPAHLPPRPTSATCRCGVVYVIAPKGPLPALCPACARERVEVAEALRVLRVAVERTGRIDSGERGRDAALLREIAQRLEPRSVRAELEDALDRLAVEGVGVEDARRLAPAMSAAAKRLLRGAGLMDGRGVLR